ncbi:hypothetical protein GN244_ATG05279 [Phytophthora infestans]|uniref:Uncharacterized protein n=1 Tax=Phytophthora infestans TaxID=4787 RepID=A0A833S7R1_PHYIN|nr:hypothetical protein GN244_ATG05279 [Phytophthora infestans]
MEEYHLDVLLKPKRTKENETAMLTERWLQNAHRKLQSTIKTQAQQNYADGLLAKWVAEFMRPLSIVEDPGLCEFYGFSRMGLLVSYETYLGSYNCKTTSSGLPLSSERH